jgi:energy-coupling factor transporter ATP-binding protein EcfA2
VPGQLVGVVGPNGCGKSNVIDAVRWVLGESRAAALRGDSMQDVIFNGSANRTPLARAAVELSFDNSLGRAAGQWSQYAEIAVKRVVQRDGESSYYINGTHVRRRDITDMFLGTGLGPRAYAIIEQGMISRVIEAKPEELRVFLEEAAGISKYKERRRETESRLAETRENLARITISGSSSAPRSRSWTPRRRLPRATRNCRTICSSSSTCSGICAAATRRPSAKSTPRSWRGPATSSRRRTPSRGTWRVASRRHAVRTIRRAMR